MSAIVPLNKAVIQDAGTCMRLAYLRVRDRSKESDGKRTAAEEVRLLYGKLVGEKARNQFPGGKLIAAGSFPEAVALTQAAMHAGESILFEAAFAFDGIGMKADVLRRIRNDEYELFEVKSGTHPEEYYEDVTVQTAVLQGLKIKVRPFLMILDKTATLKSKSLFQIVDCNQEVGELLPSIGRRIKSIQASVRAGSLPAVPFVSGCRECDYFGECLTNLPYHNVFSLYRGGKKIDGLLTQDVLALNSIPPSVTLTEQQAIQVECIRSGKAWISKDLNEELTNGVEYPIFFLDFEVAAHPIPQFDDQHPYDGLPFQWSCHVKRTRDTVAEHQEFLMDKSGDPRRPFAERLLECLGDCGSIVVYTHFEQTAIKALAKSLPDLRSRLEAMIPRLFDLHAVVLKNYYHPEFRGSFSIKQVLPVLVPQLSYENLEIGDGMAAVSAYYQLTNGKLLPSKHAVLSANLREYCKLDTLAFVHVYERLLRLSIEPSND